jgi:glycosyltransferase involved in cell wall biosynthesis
MMVEEEDGIFLTHRRSKTEPSRTTSTNPEYRLQGLPLPYNPDLTVAYPFRLGRVYSQTFIPDLIYLASPASVGFQFLIQLRQLPSAPPILLNFQTDLSAYSQILFPSPIDHYAVYLLHLVQGFLFRCSSIHTIFYPSAYVREYMQTTGAPSAKMHQLGRGVDTTLFHPAKFSRDYRRQIAPDDTLIFCCVSRLAPEKGFDFLAQVLTRLMALLPSEIKFKLLIVGGNTNPAVEAEVRNLFLPHLASHVHFTGMLRGEALARAYAISDVFLHCSVTETFGLVVLESMASRVPVIARDEGGPGETIRHGESGFLVPPGDLAAFVECAMVLAGNTRLRGEMGGKARRQAEETTWDSINSRVAERMVLALQEREVDGQGRGCYGSWVATLRAHLAVGLVWVFWLIAVMPMILCGLVRGSFV